MTLFDAGLGIKMTPRRPLNDFHEIVDFFNDARDVSARFVAIRTLETNCGELSALDRQAPREKKAIARVQMAYHR